MLKALCEAGFTPGEALLNILVISDYVSGAVLEEQAGHDREDDGIGRLEGGPGGESALTSAIVEIQDFGDGFEYGLGLLIDGMRSRLAARRPR